METCRSFRARTLFLRRTPHPAMVTIKENRDYNRVLLYSFYTTITGWGVLLNYFDRTSGFAAQGTPQKNKPDFVNRKFPKPESRPKGTLNPYCLQETLASKTLHKEHRNSQVFGGSLHSQRLPIGKMDILHRCPDERLRDFYRRWLAWIIGCGSRDWGQLVRVQDYPTPYTINLGRVKWFGPRFWASRSKD